MFNFKKIGKKVLSSVLGATLAMGGFLNTQIVKANEYNYNEEKYWDPFTMLSNAKFILGDNKRREISNLLSGVEKCITCEEVNFNELENTGADIKKVEGLSDDVSCQIAGFEGNGNKKAIVFIVVSNDYTLTKEDMEVIKNQLIENGYSKEVQEKNGIQFCNFENVNFIIRPKGRSEKFEIGEEAISGCTGATINLQGAMISRRYAIKDCTGATINLQGTTILQEYTISGCNGATINLQGATISQEEAITKCTGATINLQEATILQEYAINGCYEATINAQGANINTGLAIYGCDKAKIYYDKSTKVLPGGKVLPDYLICGGICVKFINVDDTTTTTNNNNNNGNNGNDIFNFGNGFSFDFGNGNSKESIDINVDTSNNVENVKTKEKSKKMEILKHVGIFGLIYIAFVTPIIAFKDKIKSLFSSKKIVKTPACKVKTSAV